ncbi:hypothetical protein R1T16_10470 [Flavobacterium sp. DG1-102-2]|uniref:hypothetical protein n=1 Tax=Flavobacterium sp. DG1-102-2 TaxID=3081663 RepID=UPI0029496A36|nr:hypothetical protein [Flavobacterium sp. DG1-102-2]MDV6168850.1 hypothetical protein [Flavobacterium sp. DG1-102-2]
MKRHLFVAMIALTALTACTDNDTEDTNPGGFTLHLNKTTTYYPAYENFETRNVKYYEDNVIVADSTYDNSGNFISRNIHTVTGSNYTIDTKNIEDVTIASEYINYDEQGRLTAHFGPDGEYHYTYNNNSILVEYRDPSDVFIEVGTFTLNNDGCIASHTVLSNDIITEATSLVFSGNTKPVTLTAQGTTGAIEQIGAFSYYTNTMPANLEKSTIEINNEVLRTNSLKAAALLGNYHLQDITLGSNPYYHSDTVFWGIAEYNGYPERQTITMNGQPYCHIRYAFSN